MKKIILICFLISTISYSQKPIFTSAKVKAATVYFNAVELSQTTSVNLPAGTSEIVIKNVANYVNESSVQIGAPASLTVLSVQFTNDYISEYDVDEKSPAIKKVRDSITLVKKELQKVSNTINTENKTIQLLDQNQVVSGVNSGLNVTELMKMVDFYKTKHNELANNVNSLNEKYTKLNDVLAKLNNKLEIDSSKAEKSSSGKLIVQVMNEVAGNVPLEISYLSNSATWTPFYELRAENVAAPINMLYKAQVVQNSGIDWKKVKLTLSSGNPNQNNQAPMLSAWFLRYGQSENYYGRNQMEARNSIQAKSYKKDKDTQNGYAEIQAVQAAPVALEKKTMADFTTVAENQLNVSFDIDIPYDILSNGKVHSVALTELKLQAVYKYYAVPKVEKEAFLLAEIADYSKYNLLPGEANIIFEGMYVGKTQINPSQTSDTLNLSMGRDKKVSIKREKVVDKSGTKFLSSKKEQTFTYDITVRNNKKEAIEILLKDQYPLSTDKDIEIELLQNDSSKINAETGVLTWQIQMKANETRKFRISYKVRYPKDQFIGNL